ncbi:MAG: DUF4942 domain-containing protein [Syntrophus sp. (in: bacteria)]
MNKESDLFFAQIEQNFQQMAAADTEAKTATDITKYLTLPTLVENYEKAKAETEEGFRLLKNAEERTVSVVGPAYVISMEILSPTTLATSLRKLKQCFWKYIFLKCEFYNLMSVARRTELDAQLKNGDLPDVTMANVIGTIEDMMPNVGNLAKEAITEAFEFLRPHRSRHKTNTQYEVGRKAVRERVMDSYHSGCRVSSSYEAELRSLDNAFHLMDGKGPIKWPGDIITALTEACRNNQWETETDYFHLKWFKAGTLHIEFKRQDLLAKLNSIAGGNRLKPGN